MKISMTCFLVLFFYQEVKTQSILKTMKHWPDTGQTSGFTTTFGEDNDFTFYSPAYSDNGNGTITDTVTGLIWQKTDGGEMTIEQAIQYCDTLSLAGYSDWRLPGAKEAYSIQHLEHLNPSTDTTFFTKTSAEYWWTRDRQANDSTKIWVTNAGGGIGNHPKTETISAGGTKKFHVRAVRDASLPPTIQQRFLMMNTTVIDSITMLQWQRILTTDSVTWEDALQMADTSSYAGYTDWRLPNIKELYAVTDEKLVNPCMSDTLFSNLTPALFWSSTTLINQPGKAWMMDNKFGITTYKDKTQKCNVILVRNAPTVTTGYHEVFVKSVRIYPNPFSAFISAENLNQETSCYLFDSFGNLLFNGPDLSAHDFSQLHPGLYFLSIPVLNMHVPLVKE